MWLELLRVHMAKPAMPADAQRTPRRTARSNLCCSVSVPQHEPANNMPSSKPERLSASPHCLARTGSTGPINPQPRPAQRNASAHTRFALAPMAFVMETSANKPKQLWLRFEDGRGRGVVTFETEAETVIHPVRTGRLWRRARLQVVAKRTHCVHRILAHSTRMYHRCRVLHLFRVQKRKHHCLALIRRNRFGRDRKSVV